MNKSPFTPRTITMTTTL